MWRSDHRPLRVHAPGADHRAAQTRRRCTVLMHPQSYQTWADLHAIPDKERRPEFVRKAGAQMAGQYKSQASPDGILDNTTSLQDALRRVTIENCNRVLYYKAARCVHIFVGDRCTGQVANYWSSKTNPLWPLKAPGRPRNNIA